MTSDPATNLRHTKIYLFRYSATRALVVIHRLGGWAAAYQQAESIALTCLVRSRGGPHNPSLSKTVLALALVRSSFFCSGGGMNYTPQFSLFIPHTPVRRGGGVVRGFVDVPTAAAAKNRNGGLQPWRYSSGRI